MSAPNCHACAHRGPLAPGSGHHLTCTHPVAKAAPLLALSVVMMTARLNVEPIPPALPDGFRLRVSEHGLSHSWAMWPLDFDPIWIRECSGFAARIASPSETEIAPHEP